MSKKMINRIRELREDKDLRQCDVSAATGIDQRTLSNYELGKTNPDSNAIIELAKFFNVSTDYLLGMDSARNDELKNKMIESLNEITKKLDNIKNNLLRL